MVSKARQIDPHGMCRVIKDGDFSQLTPGYHDLILSVFTFDNIPAQQKLPLFRGLRQFPEGISAAIVFLCCDQSAHITGADLVVDAGA
jgi:hypothetical protein